MKLLFAIAISNHDATRAEKLLDFIHHHSGKSGHLVLGLMSDVHDEMKSRIRISASLAFEVVHEIETRPLAERAAPKSSQTNNVFRQMASYIETTFNWPFLWLEADCTPTAKDWRERIWKAYDEQPWAFFGNRMKINQKTDKDPEIFFMARVGVYPQDAHSGMVLDADNPQPFEIRNGSKVVRHLNPTKLFQLTRIDGEGDLLKVREDAILVHGDKADCLLNQVADEAPKSEPVRIEVLNPPIAGPELKAPHPRITRRMLRESNGASK